MTGVFLSGCTDFFLIKWIANLLGFIMNLLYELLTVVGIGKIGICIIIFTILVKVFMLPISIKQQKSMKLNSVINPELQAIQKKYANKKDSESLMKQQAELTGVYEKYGTSQTAGCMPMLLSMFIIFALYGVMSCIPNYIGDLKDIYNTGVVSNIIGTDDKDKLDFHTIEELKEINALRDSLIDDKKDNLDTMLVAYLGDDKEFKESEEEDVENLVYTSFTSAYSNVFGKKSAFDVVEKAFKDAISDIEKLSKLSEEDWKKVESESLKKYADFSAEDWNKMKENYSSIQVEISKTREKIKDIYLFFSIDLSVSPANGVKLAIIIPVLSALFQLLNMKTSFSAQQKTGNDMADSMMSSMKMMNYSMVVVSAVLCYSFPAGLGLYWVISSFVQIITQFVVNKHFENLSLEDIIQESVEKANKRREKAGLQPNTISTAAMTNTKNYQTNYQKNVEEVNTVETASKGSISEKANLAKKYMDKK